jgi:hypothetical protein
MIAKQVTTTESFVECVLSLKNVFSRYIRTHLHGVGIENTFYTFYREHVLHTFMALGSISLLKAATTKSVCCSNEGRRFFI